MNPYSRFRLLSNFAAAAMMTGALCAGWPVASALLVTALGTAGLPYQLAVGGIAAALVLGSLMVSEWVFPALFQMAFLRRMVLGRHYVEGTWLQAERGPLGSERLTVLHVRPAGFGFALSGYCLNQESETESNRMIEYARLDGPVLTYAYRSLMPDGAGNQARGMGELLFEQRRGAPKAYSGLGEPLGGRRFPVEGVKLTKGAERRRLHRLDQRAAIVEKYWGLFFGAPATVETSSEAPTVTKPAVRRPVIVTPQRAEAASPAPFIERRSPDSVPDDDGPIITRRRASDWRSEDATPTADRIRARMMANVQAAEDEEEDDEDLELETDYDDDAVDADDEVMLEDEGEDDGFDTEEDEDEDAYVYEADAGDEDFIEAEEDDLDEEIDLDADEAAYAEDDEAEEAVAEEEPAEEEPLRIRQRYARRR